MRIAIPILILIVFPHIISGVAFPGGGGEGSQLPLPAQAALGSEVSQIVNQCFFSFSKLLVDVLGPVSVEELVSVEDATSARYGI